jgi:hypothetical protein
MPLEIYKSLDELLAIEPPEDEEMFPLEWDPHVLDLPLYQKDNGDLIGGIVSQRQELRQHRAVCQNGAPVFFLQNPFPPSCAVKNEERRPRPLRSIEDDGIEGHALD